MSKEKYQINSITILSGAIIVGMFSYAMFETFKEKRFYLLSAKLNSVSAENFELKEELASIKFECQSKEQPQ